MQIDRLLKMRGARSQTEAADDEGSTTSGGVGGLRRTDRDRTREAHNETEDVSSEIMRGAGRALSGVVGQPGCSYASTNGLIGCTRYCEARRTRRKKTERSSKRKYLPRAGRRGGGGGDDDEGDDQLDWEPEENERADGRGRGRFQRQRGTRTGGESSLQIQPVKQSYYYDQNTNTNDQFYRRGGGRYAGGMPPPGMFSNEALSSPSGRRNALLVMLTGAAGVAVLSSEWSTFSKFDSDVLTEETDLYVSPSGVLFARTSFGDYIEFYHDARGNSIIIDNKGSAFNLDEKVDENTYLELVNRSGRAILVPPIYIKLICKVSREFSKGILQDNTGAVDVKPAPPEISSYEKFGGGFADVMYKKDKRIRKMRFGGYLG